MLSLLSPAKTQDFKSAIPKLHAGEPIFKAEISAIVNCLKHYTPEEFSSLMDLSAKLGEAVFEKYLHFDVDNDHEENARAALFAFKGDVYRGLEADSLKPNEIAFAQSHLMILSGLYGLLRPLDYIQAYRLEMGVKFYLDDTSLYDFWRSRLTEYLNKMIREQRHRTIVNLASKEYSKAIDRKKISANWLDIDFKEYDKGKYRTISFYAKRARGMMARFILQQQIDEVEGLKGFNDGGYAFHPDLSSDSHFCFTRVKP